MDLALNKLQSLICHKTQPTNQPTIKDDYTHQDFLSDRSNAETNTDIQSMTDDITAKTPQKCCFIGGA